MNIGKFTTLERLCKSQMAERHGIDNRPDAIQLANLKLTIEKVYDPICTHFNRAITVSSCFRSPILNSLIGGAKGSHHTTGEAIDLDCDGDGTPITNNAVFYWLYNNVEFTQLIWEGGNDISPAWVHVSFDQTNLKKQVLKMKNGRYFDFEP